MISPIETSVNSPVTLAQLERAASEYEIESAALEKQIAKLDADLAEVKARHIASLKRQAGMVANREALLHSLVEAAPELFKKPRTMIISGVKLGYTTSQGKIELKHSEEAVIANIERWFELDADQFIRTSKEVNKDALRNLTDEELKKIGCKIEGAGDVVIVKRTAGEVEKLINKLITKLTEAMVNAE